MHVKHIHTFHPQAARPRARELLKEALKALQAGIAFQYAKPVLAAEVRRILPTALGVPVELGFYTAAVAAADVKGRVFRSVLHTSIK